MHYTTSYMHLFPHAFLIFSYVLMHIGSPEGVTLLEFKVVGEDQQETQQQEGLEGEG
jgi:hypothetical protein